MESFSHSQSPVLPSVALAVRIAVFAPTIYPEVLSSTGRDAQLSLCAYPPSGGSLVSRERRDRKTDALWGVPNDK